MNLSRPTVSIRAFFLAAAACVAGGLAADGRAEPPQYTLTLVDLFDDDFSNFGIALNDARQVVGYSGSPGGRHAWRWTNGVLEDIGATGGTVIEARDIDENGRVVGFGNDVNLLWVGWTWDGGELTLIPTLGGDGSRAWSTNELGEVVGDAQLPSNFWNAIMWTTRGLRGHAGDRCPRRHLGERRHHGARAPGRASGQRRLRHQ
jgi:probable HAF family extracellular repeat protein